MTGYYIEYNCFFFYVEYKNGLENISNFCRHIFFFFYKHLGLARYNTHQVYKDSATTLPEPMTDIIYQSVESIKYVSIIY